MSHIKSIPCLFLILFFATGCKIEYRPPVESPKTGYLVVEGFINSDGGPTTITLSRTLKLYDDTTRNNREHNAIVNIQGSDNESFPLHETGDGVYTSEPLQLNSNEKYRLYIKTQFGKEYESDYSSYRSTPEIDSLSWNRNNDGVKIYINTHDDAVQPTYYFWTYEETWEIHSAFLSQLVYFYSPGGLFPVGVSFRFADHSADSSLYKCWQTENSSNINIGSSEKLSNGHIYFPIMSIEPGGRKLSVLFSIQVKQYEISKAQYDYLRILKKNSEDIGSITGPLPSELKGNIQCLSNPSETVVGFVEVLQQRESERLFISNNQLPNWNYDPHCSVVSVENNPDDVKDKGDLFPTLVHEEIGLGAIKSFYATADRNCMDCTVHGSPVKPDFWP
jgi:hypothetical protein